MFGVEGQKCVRCGLFILAGMLCLWCWYGGRHVASWGESFSADEIIMDMGQESRTFACKVQVLPERVLEIISAVHRWLPSNRTRLSVCRSSWVLVVSFAHPVVCF